jgi:indole-3-acetate monooxygenase
MGRSDLGTSGRTALLDAACLAASDQADETEAGRRLAPGVVDAMRSAGSFRLFVPQVYGGPGVTVPQALNDIMALSAADGAAGWCAAIASTTSHVAGSIDPHWAREIFSNPASISGGAFAPTGQGVMTPDGLRVSGRWAWGSGSQHCDWLCAGTLDADLNFRIAFFPASDATILDTWQSSGLRGTGSHDFELHDILVPTDRWSLPVGGKTRVDDPIARMPMYTLFAGAIASVMLGIARHALDEIVTLAATKRPMGSSKGLAESSMTQVELGRAEGAWRAARAWLDDEMGEAWGTVLAGDRVSTERRASVRAAATHASMAARQATDASYDLGGGTSVYTKSPLQRCFRDVHTASAHIMVNPRNTETFGRSLLGLTIDTAML